MKKIFVLFLLISSLAHAQEDTTRYFKYSNAYGPQYPRVWGTEILRTPYLDTIALNSLPGAIQAGLDSCAYWWNGANWNKLETPGDLGLYIKYADSITGYITPRQASSVYFTKPEGSPLQYITGNGSLATFPTNISGFANDAGYVTAEGGLAGQVAFFNGTGVQGDSKFYYDPVSHKLAIGTTSTPNSELDIVSPGGGSLRIGRDNNTGGFNTVLGVDPTNGNLTIVPANDVVRVNGALYATDGIGAGSSPDNTSFLNIHPSTFGRSSLIINAGSTPLSPNDGDQWFNGTHYYMRIAGVSQQLDQQGAGVYFPLAGGTLANTDGTGYIGLPLQSNAAPTPVTGINLYSVGGLSWKGTNGFQRRFLASAITADRDYALPDATGTVGLSTYANTWSANNTFTGNIVDGSGNFLYDAANNRVVISTDGTQPAFSYKVLNVIGNSTTGILATQNLNSAGFAGVDYFDYQSNNALSVGYGNPSAGVFPNQAFFATKSTGIPMLFAINNVNKVRITNTGLSIDSSATGGLTIYKTKDTLTNTEFLKISNSNNQWVLTSNIAGTGTTARDIQINVAGRRSTFYRSPSNFYGAGSSYFNEVNLTTTSAAFDLGFSGKHNHTSGTAGSIRIANTYGGGGSGNVEDLSIIYYDSIAPSGNLYAIRVASSAVQNASGTMRDYFNVRHDGHIFLDATNTASGTTGNQTINKPSGSVNIAAGGTALTVTNSMVTTASGITATIQTNDATAQIKNVVPGTGSFVINLSAAATAEIRIFFTVIN